MGSLMELLQSGHAAFPGRVGAAQPMTLRNDGIAAPQRGFCPSLRSSWMRELTRFCWGLET